MFFLWRRYSRAGYAPPAFYIAVALGFAALAVWAITRQDWLVAAIAIAMIAVTAGGARIMRRLSVASSQSRKDVEGREHRDG